MGLQTHARAPCAGAQRFGTDARPPAQAELIVAKLRFLDVGDMASATDIDVYMEAGEGKDEDGATRAARSAPRAVRSAPRSPTPPPFPQGRTQTPFTSCSRVLRRWR